MMRTFPPFVVQVTDEAPRPEAIHEAVLVDDKAATAGGGAECRLCRMRQGYADDRTEEQGRNANKPRGTH